MHVCKKFVAEMPVDEMPVDEMSENKISVDNMPADQKCVYLMSVDERSMYTKYS